jgi:hypothetical protein
VKIDSATAARATALKRIRLVLVMKSSSSLIVILPLLWFHSVGLFSTPGR